MAKKRHYVIRVKHRLDDKWDDWFPGMSMSYEGGITTIQGLMDQARLQGLLTQIRNLGIPLISVHPQESDEMNASQEEG
ncbi:MAG: hypothetical protein JSW54_12195 [Fidelibacterota bacterium]|nr:MAG: hypothetical protein JSW54_12195 [Candidatus Neomarinimicrobiota bacterium]